jgi:hypothetical protein
MWTPGKQEVRGLRSDVETGKTDLREIRRTVEAVQTEHEYDTLNIDWAVDPAVLRIGANVHSQCLKPRHDVKLHLGTRVDSDGV